MPPWCHPTAHAPPSLLRRAGTELAPQDCVTALSLEAPSQPLKVPTESASADGGVDGFSPGNSVTTPPEPAPSKRSRAHYLWAVLIVRIYEVYRWYTHCAAARFALLRSSRTVPTYCKCSITLECRLSRQTSHQRTGRRCGKTMAMPRWCTSRTRMGSGGATGTVLRCRSGRKLVS